MLTMCVAGDIILMEAAFPEYLMPYETRKTLSA